MNTYNSNIIKQIAMKEGKTETEVRKAIMEAIDAAYKDRANHSRWGELFGDRKPSPEEFIETMVANMAN